MAKIQCVLSHHCTSFHETIYKGTNRCDIKLDVFLNDEQLAGNKGRQSLSFRLARFFSQNVVPSVAEYGSYLNICCLVKTMKLMTY